MPVDDDASPHGWEASRMPRTKRLDLPGVTQHVIQRGNDRQACFFREMDYVRYLQDWRETGLKPGVACMQTS